MTWWQSLNHSIDRSIVKVGRVTESRSLLTEEFRPFTDSERFGEVASY